MSFLLYSRPTTSENQTKLPQWNYADVDHLIAYNDENDDNMRAKYVYIISNKTYFDSSSSDSSSAFCSCLLSADCGKCLEGGAPTVAGAAGEMGGACSAGDGLRARRGDIFGDRRGSAVTGGERVAVPVGVGGASTSCL